MNSEKQAILDAATPRPWEINEERQIISRQKPAPGSDYVVVVDPLPDELPGKFGSAKADTDLIVLAVNGHEADQLLIAEMVKALRGAYHDSATLSVNTVHQLCEALAHAREQKPELFK